MNPMSRFALFTIALITIVAIGSQPRHGMNLSKSMKDMCVCVPARAGLMAKAALAEDAGSVCGTIEGDRWRVISAGAIAILTSERITGNYTGRLVNFLVSRQLAQCGSRSAPPCACQLDDLILSLTEEVSRPFGSQCPLLPMRKREIIPCGVDSIHIGKSQHINNCFRFLLVETHS